MTDDTLSKAERDAVKARASELKKQASRKGAGKAEREAQDCLDVIAGLPDPDKAIAQMVHEVVAEVAPTLRPKTWYGFPSYARDGKVIVFYQQASKFETRYGTLGFQDDAALDDGEMWPTSFAITGTSLETRERIAQLVSRAAS